MKIYGSAYLVAAALSCMLNLGPSSARAYYPPLQATATYSSHSVTYNVYNPQTQQGYSGTLVTVGTIVNLQQHNGVIAWVVQDGTDYTVDMVTFDPALNRFQNAWQGPFVTVSHLSVMDGVVAYSIVDSSGYPGFGCVTYDPAKGGWQYYTYSVSSPETLCSTTEVKNKDGVVVYRVFCDWLDGNFSDSVLPQIYDYQIGSWSNPFWAGLVDLYFADVSISNATVYFRNQDSIITYFCGYVPGTAFWEWNVTTPPTAYFVAQPKLGIKPLWVWFTDLSINGTFWNWNFGDNSGSTNRSPYHTFTSSGNYQVILQINGPSTYTQTILVRSNRGLPPILQLLLLAD